MGGPGGHERLHLPGQVAGPHRAAAEAAARGDRDARAAGVPDALLRCLDALDVSHECMTDRVETSVTPFVASKRATSL